MSLPLLQAHSRCLLLCLCSLHPPISPPLLSSPTPSKDFSNNPTHTDKYTHVYAFGEIRSERSSITLSLTHTHTHTHTPMHRHKHKHTHTHTNTRARTRAPNTHTHTLTH